MTYDEETELLKRVGRQLLGENIVFTPRLLETIRAIFRENLRRHEALSESA